MKVIVRRGYRQSMPPLFFLSLFLLLFSLSKSEAGKEFHFFVLADRRRDVADPPVVLSTKTEETRRVKIERHKATEEDSELPPLHYEDNKQSERSLAASSSSSSSSSSLPLTRGSRLSLIHSHGHSASSLPSEKKEEEREKQPSMLGLSGLRREEEEEEEEEQKEEEEKADPTNPSQTSPADLQTSKEREEEEAAEEERLHREAIQSTGGEEEKKKKKDRENPIGRCLDELKREGRTPSATRKLEELKKTNTLVDSIHEKRRQAARECLQGKKEKCETPERSIWVILGIPEPSPASSASSIAPFHLSTACEGDTRKIQSQQTDELSSPSLLDKSEERLSSSSSSPSSSPGASLPRHQTHEEEEEADRLSQHRRHPSLPLEPEGSEESMVEASARIFNLISNLFGNGADISNPQNFEGGNQGSYFDFMYPQSTDYPWACVCDENTYKRYEAGEVEAVPCRNQVDMSAQGITAACNPKNHKMNDTVHRYSISPLSILLYVSIAIGTATLAIGDP